MPAPQEEIVTVWHASPLLLDENVDPATQFVHTPLLVVVAGVSPLPVVHVVVVTVAHGFEFVPAL